MREFFRRNGHLLSLHLIALLALATAGCTSLNRPNVAAAKAAAAAEGYETPADRNGAVTMLQQAETLYQAGQFTDSLRALVDASRRDPTTPGLNRMQKRVMQALLDQRSADAATTAEQDRLGLALETLEKGQVPPSYNVRKALGPAGSGDGGTVPESMSAGGFSMGMQNVLGTPVSLSLKGADLPALIQALSQVPGVNLIADEALGADKKINVEVSDVPLREVLDYIAGNFGIRYHYGQNSIWASAADGGGAVPLVTRVFKLQQGIQYEGNAWGLGVPPSKDGGPVDDDVDRISNKATVLSERPTYIENVISNFVPRVEGAKVHFDRNTHSLFVRDTPDNLETIEALVETLDVTPPQVFIEARFLEVTVADLRELGVEWILDSPLVTSTKNVLQDGTLTDVPRTLVEGGGSISSIPFGSDEGGPNPLGPQGAFGEVRSGNPDRTGQGLNLAFKGILTQPMYQAVLHALDISGKGRTLSVPRLSTVNNNPAKLRDGQDLLYFDEFQAQAFNLVDEANKRFTVTVLIPKGKPLLEELGITLVAVPSVGADRRTISLLLTPTISALEGFINYQDESATQLDETALNQIRQVVVRLPIIRRRQVQTKVIVQSGETVVMGGLIDTVEQDTEHGVPFLSAIPGIGKLFSRKDTTADRRNLLIFVTATVLSDRGESLVSRTPARAPIEPMRLVPPPAPAAEPDLPALNNPAEPATTPRRRGGLLQGNLFPPRRAVQKQPVFSAPSEPIPQPAVRPRTRSIKIP